MRAHDERSDATEYVGLYLKTGYSLPPPGVTTLGGLAGLAPEPVTGIQRALGEPTGSPWPLARPSGKQWRRQVRALEREQHRRSARSAVPRKKNFAAVRHSRRSRRDRAGPART